MEDQSSGKDSKNALASERIDTQHDKGKAPANFSGTAGSDRSTNSAGNVKKESGREGEKDENQDWESPLIRGI